MASSSDDDVSEKERFEVQPLAHARHQLACTRTRAK